jgi:hypothetical protein
MARGAEPQQPAVNPLGAPSVIGLDGGREVARRRSRRRQRKDQLIRAVGAVVALGVVVAAAYVGYTIFDEQQATDRIETEQRQAEFELQGSGNDLRDAIGELEESPRWNGPGNPTFGVGKDAVDTSP